MRNCNLILSIFGIPLLLCADTPDFDKGGVSFAMEQISENHIHSDSMRKNLLENGDFTRKLMKRPGYGSWYPHSWISGKGEIKEKEMDARAFGKVRIGEGMLEISRSQELETLLGSSSVRFCNTASQFVKLSGNPGDSYRLEFEYRDLRPGQHPAYAYVIVTWYDKSSPDLKSCRQLGYQTLKLTPSPERRTFSRVLHPPAEAGIVNLAFRGDGVGTLQVWNAGLFAVEPDSPLFIDSFPCVFLDKCSVLAQDSPGLLGFRLKNNLSRKKTDLSSAVLQLELPAEIRLIGSNRFLQSAIHSVSFRKNGGEWRRYSLPLDDHFLSVLCSTNEPQNWNIPMVMIESSASPGREWSDCRFLLRSGEKILSNCGNLKIRMAPKLPAVTGGGHFLTGLVSCGADMNFHSAKSSEKLAALWGRSGVKYAVVKGSPDFVRLLQAAGVKYITSQSSSIANGYRIGRFPEGRKPPESGFYDKDGKLVFDRTGAAATCPHAIYSRSAYFREQVVPIIRQLVFPGMSGFSPNWEPYMFLNSGCFCERCMRDFAAFAKLPLEKVKTIWPGQLQIGFPYRDTAIRFRAWQHGQLVRTLHHEVLAAGGTDLGFIPMVGTDQLIRYPGSFQEQYEFSPYEYADAISHLFVWGPYQWFSGEEPFVYVKGSHLRQYAYASAVIRDYNRKFSDPRKRARILGMPHGIQGVYLGQPEGMAMDQLSNFIAGFDGSLLYFFPRSYDHRFMKAYIDANSRIAENEDMVMTGERLHNIRVRSESPYAASLRNPYPKYLPEQKEMKLLQVAGFRKGDRILAAVGNFWEKGDVVFRLSISGLEKEKDYSVIEKAFSRSFTKEGNKPFKGKDLERGILLHVGALRWAFFEILPGEKGGIMPLTIDVERMEKELLRCKKENQGAADDEAKRDALLLQQNTVGPLKTLRAGDFQCVEALNQGRSVLNLKSGKNLMMVDPLGLKLFSWKLDGHELIQNTFGVSAFWSPGKRGAYLDCNFRITGQSLEKDYCLITGELVTTSRTYPELPGLKLRKTLKISRDLTKLEILVRLSNPHPEAMNQVAYRWHLIPACWSSKNNGFLDFSGPNMPHSILKRTNQRTLLLNSGGKGYSSILKQIFHVSAGGITEREFKGKVVFSDKKRVRAQFLPENRIIGAAVWDTPNMPSPTFEPLYLPQIIPPGESISFMARFSVE